MFAPASYQAAGAFLLAVSLKVTLLLACAALIASVLRRSSSALRHRVWSAAILAALALPLLISFLPAWHSSALSTMASAFAVPHAPVLNPGPSTLPSLTVNAIPASAIPGKLVLSLLFVWLLGSFLLLARFLVGLARLARLCAQSKPFFEDVWMREVLNLSASLKISRSIRLLECPSPLAMPLTCGLFRLLLLLPAGAAQWPADRRRMILTHELAHIARHDWFLQICAELARVFYWFHPLVWFAAAQLRHESERACDDAVLNHGVSPSHYASQLLDLARTLKNPGRAWSTALAIARPSNLERRFAAMLNPSLDRRTLSVRTKLLIPFFSLCLLLPLAALRLTAQNLSGRITGSIHDPSGTGVANATVILSTVILSNHAANTIDMTTSDRDGNFTFKSLPAGQYEFQVLKPGFEKYDLPQVTLEPGRDFSQAVMLKIGEVSERVQVTPENSDKAAGTEKNNDKPSRIRLGGDVEAAQLKSRVLPVYPESAKSAGISGTVVLHAVIGTDGRPLSLRVMNSQIDPDLAKSAVEAVKDWRYTPTLLNGEPIEVDTIIQVNYTLQP
jgi:TonB family protein